MGLVTRLGSVDVVFRVDGFAGNAYEALAERALSIKVGDVEFRVGSMEDLVRSKRAAGRRKDLEHLPILERLLAERRLSPPATFGRWGGGVPGGRRPQAGDHPGPRRGRAPDALPAALERKPLAAVTPLDVRRLVEDMARRLAPSTVIAQAAGALLAGAVRRGARR